MAPIVRLLLVSGSTRDGSTNSAALRAARDEAPADVVATLYDGLADLPAFNPDDEEHGPVHPAVARLREQLAAADAVLFCTPEYAGTLPGSFKNLLDWTVGNGDLYEKPVAWINVAAEGRGGGALQDTLATVLRYVTATVIEQALRAGDGRSPRRRTGRDRSPTRTSAPACAGSSTSIADHVRGLRILDDR